MADPLVAKSVNRPRKHQRRSTIRILEEAVHLLRLSPGPLLVYYYIGSLPFILGLLYFWGDMSHSAFAADYSAIASLGMALLFIWMKSWQAVFATRIKAQLDNQTAYRFDWRRILPLVANQTLIHASGFFVLPLAAVVLIPFGWCFAFYQNVTVLEDRQYQDLSVLVRRSWYQARLWPKQNHLLLTVFFFFGLMVYLNLAITLFILPYLLKTFFGLESVFTLSGLDSLNTTFLATTVGITYLCMDPVIKTAYTLRCYYGEALTTGADIKNQLNRFGQQGKALTFLTVLALTLSFATHVAAESHQIVSRPLGSTSDPLSVEQLDQSIEKVLRQREFTWRMPRQRISETGSQKSGPVSSAFQWIWRMIVKGLKTLGGWLVNFFEWLIDLLPKADLRKKPAGSSRSNLLKIMLIVLLSSAVMVLLFFIWRIRQQRRIKSTPPVAETVLVTPELTDDDLRADELPANRWIAMAKELFEKGSVRLAMRALYLATLAHLAEHGLITIEAYKSNLDYKRELQRRAHGNQELLRAFATVVTLLEKVWYGMHKIPQQEIDAFTKTQQRIMRFAEE